MRGDILETVFDAPNERGCDRYWLLSHAPSGGTMLGGERWGGTWMIDRCSRPALAHVELRRDGNGIRWSLEEQAASRD